MLELVFYNATRQGQTWWIASFHYCHLKDYSLEEERVEVDGGIEEGWVSNVTSGESRGWVALLIKKTQIKCPSLIQGPATLTLLHSPHLAFHDFFYVSCSFKSERLYSQWQNTEATREGLMEMTGGKERERKGTKSFKREGTENQREEAAGAGPLIITDTLYYLRRNVCMDVSMCVSVEWQECKGHGVV